MIVVVETVSTPDGTVRFAGWGPRRVTLFTTPSVLDWPELLIFKTGYRPLQLTNSYTSPPGKRISDHHGGHIKLVPFRGDNEQWAQELHRLKGFLDFAYLPRNCEWKQIPLMLGALVREGDRLFADGERSAPTSSWLERIARPERCGSARAYIREQSK